MAGTPRKRGIGGKTDGPASAVWRTAVSPAAFAVLCLLWCADLGAGSLIAYGRPGLFGNMDALPFARWLDRFGPRAFPSSLWVYLLVALTWLMVASLALCSLNWLMLTRRRARRAGELLVHLGFLLVFSGYVVGSLSGWRLHGVVVPSGQAAPLPGTRFSLVTDRLETVRDAGGSVLDTVSSLSLLEDGGVVGGGTVRTNHPFMRGALVVYPRGSAFRVTGGRLRVGDAGTFALDVRESARISGVGSLVVWSTVQPEETVGPYRGPGLFITLRDEKDVPLRSAFLAPRPGESSALLNGLPVALAGLSRSESALYDVHYDPGVPLVLAGALILALGTLWALVAYLATGSGGAARGGTAS